jgi:hypothetical protein
MRKLCVQLSGGLGNQMFQYAAARAFALDNQLQLVLDRWSGFARDKQYKRNYELNRLPIKKLLANFLMRLPLWMFRVECKLFRLTSDTFQKKWYGDFFIEHTFNFSSNLFSLSPGMNIWMLGYWQSPRYFHGHENLLQIELMPPEPSNKLFVDLAQLIAQSDSVSVGVRLYEESINPADHALNGKVKTVEDINKAITKMRAARPSARFFIFCSHHSTELDKLNLPGDTIFVTPDHGFRDAVDCLWLLTRCKHHIFTNSSFYWWGAWLSQVLYKQEEQLIYAADNFINTDGLCEHWNRF